MRFGLPRANLTLLLIMGVAVLAGFKWVRNAVADSPVERLAITPQVRAVTLDIENPDRQRVGALTYRGGLLIADKAHGFGGFSGLLASHDGSKVVAVSDRTGWMAGDLEWKNGTLRTIRNVRIGPIPGHTNERLDQESHQDVEAITATDSQVIIALENAPMLFSAQQNKVEFLADPFAQPLKWLYLPISLHVQPRNSGIETAEFLPDGRLLLALEKDRGKKKPSAWTGTFRNYEIGETYIASALAFPRKKGFRPTDAAQGKEHLYILYRRFKPSEGVRVAIHRISVQDIGKKDVASEELALLETPVAVDNFEGLAIVNRGGREILLIISDDNFNPLQRTLLLAFEPDQ